MSGSVKALLFLAAAGIAGYLGIRTLAATSSRPVAKPTPLAAPEQTVVPEILEKCLRHPIPVIRIGQRPEDVQVPLRAPQAVHVNGLPFRLSVRAQRNVSHDRQETRNLYHPKP